MPFFDILFKNEQLRLYGLHTVTDEIGRLKESVPGVSTIISPWIANRISSPAAVSECLHQLHLFKPWSRKIEDEMEINDSQLRNSYKDAFRDWIPVLGVKFEGSQVYRSANPTDGKFDYPVHRKRNMQNVGILRKAEASLNTF
jgi:hypothetical protein